MALLGVAFLLGGPTEASAQLGALVSPGRLTRAHAQLEGVSNCLQCHSKGQQVSANKCLACHKPVAQRIAAKKGVHRAVTTDCVACHVEHAGVDAELRPFDTKNFDHARDAGFALDGLHAPIASQCTACHKTRSFLSAQTTCASCHADPHKGTLGKTCVGCHSTSVKFIDASKRFDHANTKFPLKGAHGDVACATCHKNKQFTGLSFSSCASCHTDPHKAKMNGACESCHNESSWRTTKVNHSRTAFPLLGKHAAVECVKCHTKSAVRVTVRFDTCAGCHADPHRGVFAPKDCGACHTESGFKGARFDHASTRFPLVDKHEGLACVACHKTATLQANDFRGLKTSCNSCHQDVHQGELGSSCEQCHTTRSFVVAAFTHTRQRAFFAGQHSSLTCAQCHTNTMKPARTAGPVVLRVGFTTTPATCASCHKDVHLGQVSTACESCHSVEAARFKVTGFSHATTPFPLTGKHSAVLCEKCHRVETGSFPAGTGTARRLTGIGTECATCHTDPHQGQLDRSCQACHTTETFALPRYVHKNARALKDFFTGQHNSATCVRCHAPLAGAATGTKPVANYRISTTCTACHTDVHRGALGTDCAACHKPLGGPP